MVILVAAGTIVVATFANRNSTKGAESNGSGGSMSKDFWRGVIGAIGRSFSSSSGGVGCLRFD